MNSLKTKKVVRCPNCLITNKCPKTEIEENGLCNHCNDYNKGVRPTGKHFMSYEDKKVYREAMDKTLKTVRGKGKYDALVGFSGGKDSTYLLYYLKKNYPDLRILPLTIDMSFLNKQAFENVNFVVDKLKLDHVYIKAKTDFYKKFFKYLFEHRKPGGYKAVSYMCENMTEKEMGFCDYCHSFNDGLIIKYAFQNDIPLVITGFSPGQPMYWFYELTPEEVGSKSHIPDFLYNEPFTEEDRDYYWDPTKYPKDSNFPHLIFPFHVLEYNADKYRDEIVKAGLIQDYKKTSPANTNCSLNLAMTTIDYLIDEYFMMLPYASRMIRMGELNKKEWAIRFKILENILKFSEINYKYFPKLFHMKKVKEVEELLGINVEEIVKQNIHQRGKLNF